MQYGKGVAKQKGCAGGGSEVPSAGPSSPRITRRRKRGVVMQKSESKHTPRVEKGQIHARAHTLTDGRRRNVVPTSPGWLAAAEHVGQGVRIVPHPCSRCAVIR